VRRDPKKIDFLFCDKVLRQVESPSLNATTLLKNSLDYTCGYILFTIDISEMEEKREASPEPTASLGSGA
jgi:hypothetical protein